ncbi:tetratricopeptide repeat protein [Roseateles chitinivorans]|uniref:tetratricopeptide repeat protein n=1 Tax=Roseateles chitinivorans TaxID=2917965 RepID=UPI003D66E364
MKTPMIMRRSKRWVLLALLGVMVLNPAQAALSAADCEARLRAPDLNNAPLSLDSLRRVEQREATCLGTGMFDVRLAGEYLLSGDTTGATRVVERALTKQNNARPNLLHMQVRIDLKLGKVDRAIRWGEAMAIDYPEYSLIQFELAGIAFKQQDWSRALRHARRAYEIEGSALSLMSMAAALHQLDRHEECIAAVRQALKLDPRRIAKIPGLLEGIYSLGVLNRRVEAAELVRQHIAANPNWRANAAFVEAAKALGVV